GGASDSGGDAAPDSGTAPDAAADASAPLCAPSPPPSCDAAPPDPGATSAWRHPVASRFSASAGAQRHRGRDLFLREGDAQWALAKFAYGSTDKDLKDEQVRIWLDRGCAGTWELLGTSLTTNDGDHADVYGVTDTGGWVFFPIPDSARLGVGRHRLHFAVAGDLSTTDQLIEVLPPEAHVVVSDVDGTLTESETAEFLTLVSGPSPAANDGAPEVLWALARRGYRIFYLTARPEWLATRTHEWLSERGFPPGLVHTTLGFMGATGAAATRFKAGELRALDAVLSQPPDWGFGNKPSDAEAYAGDAIPAAHRLLYQMTGDAMGGVVFDDYRALLTDAEAAPLVCR
ncbi:MAG: phosphatidylinositol transfer protein, partial [Deltaproteobacteria bacterium]|nr:phosphatidylinositol transfer protein [Deltaproteobacteria bacterium]